MSGLNPADLGIFETDDNSDDSGENLPSPVLPPKPDDLRTKKGREWKKLKAEFDAGRPVKLEGPTARETASKSEGSRGTRRNVQHFRKVFANAHKKIAEAVDDDTWILDDEESNMMAEGLADLLSYYKIIVTGKGGAWLALIYAITLVYGVRVFPTVLPIIMNMFGRKEEEPQQTNQNVIRTNFSI